MPVPVRFRDCACPGTPHAEAGDIAYLPEKVPLVVGTAFEFVVSRGGDVGTILSRMTEAFVRHGPSGWNLLDESGNPRPIDTEELVADYTIAKPIAEKANELWAGVLLAPLVAQASKSSRRGRTARPSTSPKPIGVQ